MIAYMTLHYLGPFFFAVWPHLWLTASAMPTSTLFFILLTLTSGNSLLQNIHKAKSFTSFKSLLKPYSLNKDHLHHLIYLKVPSLPNNFCLFCSLVCFKYL